MIGGERGWEPPGPREEGIQRPCAVISFTRGGGQTAARLAQGLAQEGWEVENSCLPKWAAEFPQAKPVEGSLAQWCGQRFRPGGGLVFVGACGIAVRTIAPFIRGKTQDPAVVVVDEKGEFAVSLLSGHLGGGNRLARAAARILGGAPVITTATDVRNRFAVDVWAQENGLSIPSLALAKEISAAVLSGEPVAFASEFPVEGTVPAELSGGPDARLSLEVGIHRKETPVFAPRCLVLGLGCRKGKTAEEIGALVDRALAEAGILPEAVAGAASIDWKRQEEGLLSLCRSRGWPLRFFSAEELAAVPGDFSPSAFVSRTVGVDNVCERAAVLASGGGSLLVKKQAENGVTLAVARENRRICFG